MTSSRIPGHDGVSPEPGFTVKGGAASSAPPRLYYKRQILEKGFVFCARRDGMLTPIGETSPLPDIDVNARANSLAPATVCACCYAREECRNG